jgi:putative DNA methylase
VTRVTPLSLKDAPALIERLLPVQKLSAEVYKERMAGSGQTLTALGSYWKGRKPLILNKACILGCLLPVTKDHTRDLEIFEMLMGMDDESFVARLKFHPKPKEIVATLPITRITDYFTVEPLRILPAAAPVNMSKPEYTRVQVSWRDGITEMDRRRLEAQMLPKVSYHTRVEEAFRPEEVNSVHDHIWDAINAHLNTYAQSFPELVEQLGIMRFGHRPRVADPFCGSGQIPFEAARLGCDAYASDLNPVACMLTWGAFNIIGGSAESREKLAQNQQDLVARVQAKIDALGIDSDGRGWRTKVFLYCVEALCPHTGWIVPLIPSLVISRDKRCIAELVPDSEHKRYDIVLRFGVSERELKDAAQGTVRKDGRGQDPYLLHKAKDNEFRTKISTLRGDYRKENGGNGNRLRLWEKHDFKPRSDDIFRERLYCVQWMRQKREGKGVEYEFRSVTEDDLKREKIVEDIVRQHIAEWQKKGWLPDMRIEPGSETTRLSRERGWTYWHHLFNARQLLIFSTMYSLCKNSAVSTVAVTGALDRSSRLCAWGTSKGRDAPVNVFSNQALNTLFTYGSYGSSELLRLTDKAINRQWTTLAGTSLVLCQEASKWACNADIYITDPPYGDAVKYEEILEFFIAWMRKNPPPEFADWIWDSRRSLAITGENEDFRRAMVAAYRRTTECMPDNGIQIIMFTHQSGSIWADMANIVWASGLRVTAAWYVATETNNVLREGSYVKGTVLLVLRKRAGTHKTTRDDLAWEIQEEVKAQVDALTGLNQGAKGFYRAENVFEDADIQMAGYAAALRVLTTYAIIDGRDMTAEAIRPRVNRETTFVDGLIGFAVDAANQSLVPQGISKAHWDKLSGAERFYLKMLDMECRGAKKLDNYQNFAKAFKVRDFRTLMASQIANESRLKSAVEFGKNEMSEGSELNESVLRAVLYAVMELVKNVDGNEVLAHMMLNISNYYSDVTRREMVVELANYLAKQLEGLRPEEAGNARVLYELVNNQRLG